ncbi:MFS transporter [Amycolatopsis balhimycina DSM 5908]|uniref:MFS transporter n=1 Tax=Amycolatopsis balhimycina DSM 5908 TaxID=1081091 RepID=A0A428WP44_AMYBA|nr:MFS transporter [Amycolatopsis balhimycina]RSM44856.1 MFS transporter [Amycolatopsis balhimycina DSM 5908]
MWRHRVERQNPASSRHSGPGRRNRRRGLAPLRHRGFRYLLSGQLASNIGDACYAVALPWYVLAESGGTLLLGTTLVAYGLPRTALMAFGGLASDRWRPWTVMMVSDIVRTVAAAALAVAALLGPARAEFLVPVAVVLGAGEGLFLPGSFVIAPKLLPDTELQAGNALSYSGTQLSLLIGPALGSVVVPWLGVGAAFAVDAVTFALSALSLAGIRSASTPAVPRRHTVAGKPTLRRLLLGEPTLLVVLAITLAGSLGSGGLSEVAVPALAHGPLHTGAGGYGALLAALGAGALLGTVVAARLSRPRRPAVLCSAACLMQALMIGLAPYLGGAVTAGLALFGYGLCNALANIIMITALQRWAPPNLLGRVMGLLLLAGFGIFPISAAFGALLVDRLGPAPFFPVAGAILVAAVLGSMTQRRWRDLGRVPSHGRDGASET